METCGGERRVMEHAKKVRSPRDAGEERQGKK